MAHRPELFRPVGAEGSLRLDTPSGQSLNLVADGQELRLDMPRWADARAALPRSFRARRRTIRFVARTLATHGLTLSLESAGNPVMRLGHNTSPSWLARLLGLGLAHIPVSALRLLFRR